ncbi:MAG: family 16 glycoside hydrolase, partial [Bacteroidota bacterium]
MYQRWDDTKPEGQKGYEGTPPALNASRAPGLWQSMKIRFQAPRFDDNGSKIANARILSVIYNGKQIHRDVELSGPTRGSFFEDEAATGPFIMQGDHGPIAFRNLGYKAFGDAKVKFQDLQYAFYEVETDKRKADLIADYSLAAMTPADQGAVDTISRHLAGRKDNHILDFQGKMIIPESGDYLFKAKVGGGLSLKIDGEEILLADGERGYQEPAEYARKKLGAGEHSFQLTFLQNHQWWRNGIGLWIEGPGIDFQPLHAEGSVPPYRPPNPIWIEASDRAKIMRGFVMFDGDKLTHTASIGSPDGQHFNYDLNQAKLLHIWRGPFLDVSPMWRGRGVS